MGARGDVAHPLHQQITPALRMRGAIHVDGQGQRPLGFDLFEGRARDRPERWELWDNPVGLTRNSSRPTVLRIFGPGPTGSDYFDNAPST
jgi:hypothetical protein